MQGLVTLVDIIEEMIGELGNCVIEVLHVQNQAIKVARLQRLPAKQAI